MSTVEDVITAYMRLRDECDKTFRKIQMEFPDEMECKEGCDACCQLSSVTYLEGRMITDHLKSSRHNIDRNSQGKCIFLTDGLCSIYPVRPIICRTHGVLLYDSENDRLERSCNKNFQDQNRQSFDKSHALDIHRITGQLIRLNVLYCHFTGRDMSEDGRTSLINLLDMSEE